MAYANGTATRSTDLLQQLVTFLVANGWTQDMSQAEGLGWRAHLHKSGNYVHLRARELEGAFQNCASGIGAYGIDLYLGTGFNGATVWNNQTTGAPVGSGASYPVGVACYLSVGPFSNHYFFTDSTADNVVVVVERTPGQFFHFGWGLSLAKAGAYTGGAYFFGSSSGFYGSQSGSLGSNLAGYTATSECPGGNTDSWQPLPVCFVRADVDSFTGKWVCIAPLSSGGSLPATQGYTGKAGASTVKGKNVNVAASLPCYAQSDGANEFQPLQTSSQDGRANLLPVYLFALRDGTTTGFSLLGSIPTVFFSNGVGNGFSNASEYAIGAQTYKLFPNFAVLKV